MKRMLLSTTVLASVLLASGCRSERERNGDSQSAAMAVRTASVERRVFIESLRVQGTLVAVHRANISARLPGAIDALYVDAGDTVSQGQPLFQTDKVNLENAVAIEHENLRVAESSVTGARIALQQAEATFEKASLDLERFRRLYEVERAVTKDAFEKVNLDSKQAATGLEHAKATVTLVAARKQQAATALRIAEKNLSDSLVRAPFDGVVTRRLKQPGEFVGAGVPVLALENPSHLEVVFTLSEQWFSRIEPGRTRVRITAAGQPPVDATVSVRSPSVHPIARTVEVKAPLTPVSGFAPGMICDVDVVFAQHEGWGAPAEAVGTRNGRSVVFVVEKDTARQRDVRPGLRDNGYLELLDGESLSGLALIVEGQTFLNDGEIVRVVKSERAER